MTAEDWRSALAGQFEQLADAWSADAAWAGTVTVSSEMPATVLGDMAYAETLLHGWDVARALGAELAVSPEMAAVLLAGVEETAELGRRMEAYGDPPWRCPRTPTTSSERWGSPAAIRTGPADGSALAVGQLQFPPDRPPDLLGRRSVV